MKGSSADALLDDGPKLEVPSTAILMVMITMFIDTLAGSISTPVMPFYARAFNVSTANIGWLYALWSFSSTVFAPVLTSMADKIGRRPVLIMSLVGAGVANIIQGVALDFGTWGFSIFLFGRFFSGIWAAVGATCNVYITDVTPDELRPIYIAKMSTVPLVAMLFGPGLGGGLSKLGLNVPVMVDGAITLFSACLVAYYLPETPAFLRHRLSTNASLESGSPVEEKAKTKVPRVVYALGFAQFLGGIGFSTLLSSFAIFMMERYADFDALRVGFCFMGSSIVMVMVNVWGVPFAKKRLSIAQCVFVGGIINAIGFLCFAFSRVLVATLLSFALAMAGNALRGANSTAYLGSFSDVTNRGRIFGISQVFMNCGRMVGPVLATQLAERFDVGTPFIVASLLSVVSAGIFLLADSWQGKASPPSASPSVRLERTLTKFGDEWVDEVGKKEDIEAIGKFVSDLLAKRHYRWMSKRSEIESLLEHLLPELHTSDREAYEAAIECVEGKSLY